jgi:hypothetical protein
MLLGIRSSINITCSSETMCFCVAGLQRRRRVTKLIPPETWDGIKAAVRSVPGFQQHSSKERYAAHETVSMGLQAGALVVAVVAAPATLSTAALCACAGGAVVATRIAVGAVWGWLDWN